MRAATRQSFRDSTPIETPSGATCRRAFRSLVLLSLVTVALGVSVSAASADSQPGAETDVDEGSVSDVYRGDRVEGAEVVTDLARTDDGGLVALRYAAASAESTILRIDGSGDVVHRETTSGMLQSIERVGDDSYAAVGARDGDVLVAWTRADGAVEWTETYGGSGRDLSLDAVSAPDGDAYVLASTESFGVETSDLWVLRVDGSGETVWDRRVEHEKWTAFPVGERLEDGGLIATIRTERSMDKSVDGNQNVSVARIAPDGTVVWRTVVKGAGDPVDKDEMAEVVRAHGDGVLIFGLSNSGNERWHPDFWTTRLASDGEVLWQRHYDTPNRAYGSTVVRTREGYLLGGFFEREDDAPSVGKVVAIGEDGTQRFTRTYDPVPQLTTRVTSADWTADGQFVVGGATFHRAQNRSQGWIVDLTEAVSPVEPPDAREDREGSSDGSERSDGDTARNGESRTATPAAASTGGSASDELVLYAAAATSFVVLFVPFGMRRIRRR